MKRATKFFIVNEEPVTTLHVAKEIGTQQGTE